VSTILLFLNVPFFFFVTVLGKARQTRFLAMTVYKYDLLVSLDYWFASFPLSRVGGRCRVIVSDMVRNDLKSLEISMFFTFSGKVRKGLEF